MIPRFTDYAANERTYLAWVRTAISIMAFGFLVERFDLFLAYLGHSAGVAVAQATHRIHGAQIAGLLLIGLAILIMMFATARFLHHRKRIACEESVDYGSALGDNLLAILMILFAVFLVVYMIHQLQTMG